MPEAATSTGCDHPGRNGFLTLSLHVQPQGMLGVLCRARGLAGTRATVRHHVKPESTVRIRQLLSTI
jgi:hypothetical protein